MGEREHPTTADPSISVLVPSLNAGPFVGDAIRSALGQPIPPREVLVQDGGSRDETVAIAGAIADPRVSVVSEPDRGQSDALNRGLQRARGDWIVWLNADDLLARGAFAAAAPVAREDVDVVYGDYGYIDDNDEVIQEFTVADTLDRERLLRQGCQIFSGAALFRRSVFDRFGGLDTGLRMAMDYDLFLRIAPHVRAVHCGETLAYLRRHRSSATAEISWRLVREDVRVRRRHGGYSRRNAAPTLLYDAKRVLDVSSLPIRRAVRRRHG
jgi:glycosyltransferase involved in cell wall biosynthesis